MSTKLRKIPQTGVLIKRNDNKQHIYAINPDEVTADSHPKIIPRIFQNDIENLDKNLENLPKKNIKKSLNAANTDDKIEDFSKTEVPQLEENLKNKQEISVSKNPTKEKVAEKNSSITEEIYDQNVQQIIQKQSHIEDLYLKVPQENAYQYFGFNSTASDQLPLWRKSNVGLVIDCISFQFRGT